MKNLIFIICFLTGYLYLSAQNNCQEEELKISLLNIKIAGIYDIEYIKKYVHEKNDLIDLRPGINPMEHNIIDISSRGEEEYYKNYTPVIIPEYFLLGTLQLFYRSMGYIRSDYHFDFYDDYQEYKVNYLKQYIHDKLGIDIQAEQSSGGHFYLISPEITEILNTNYFEDGGKKLRTDIFQTKEQVCSFLLGAYFQSGGVRDKSYSIRTALSSELIFSLLRDARCRKILFSEGRSTIGWGYNKTFDFYPSVLLKKYFDAYDILLRELCMSIYGFIPDSKENNSSDQDEENKIYEQEMIRQEKVIKDAFNIYEYFD